MDIRKALKPEEPKVCEICNADFSKYICPKCGIPYCSLTCYKDVNKHLKCSESFYRDCVVESMKVDQAETAAAASTSSASQSEKGPTCKEMKEMLERIQGNQEEVNNLLYNEEEESCSEASSDSSLDSDDDESLKKRMEGVDLDDANKVWSKLNLDEKKGFQEFVKEYKEKYEIDDIEDD